MRRSVFFIGIFLVLYGCGGKRVQVGIPSSALSSELEGIASYYAEPYHGRRTANGETFDTYNAMTAAHRTLSFNTIVRVRNKSNGKEIEVRINDRGPFIEGRVIDLSLRAARALDMVRAGVIPVKLEIVSYGAAKENAGPGPMYSVQVGAFENLRSAEDLKGRLQREYPGVTVQTFSGQKTVYRVRIGREANIQAAHRLASELRNKDFDTFVVRVN